jgi:hypothetical protein
MTSPSAADTILSEFENAWRDDVPVFACCRRSVATAVEKADLGEIASLDVTARVQTIRDAVESGNPGYLASHRCCAGHLTNLAFDLPDLVAKVHSA